MSAELALHVLDRIREAGVRTICVCPGARNADWVRLLAADASDFELIWHFEERSAAFFALGRIRAAGRPSAVITTSGTAAGELLPATMEAFYSGLPLFLLTADRPRRFKGSGAPQAAEQAGLFGIYAPTAFDLERCERIEKPIIADRKPVHINVHFEDPNAATDPHSRRQPPGRPTSESLGASIARYEHPVVIVGALAGGDRAVVEEFLVGLGAPVYLEAPSGLRDSTELEPIKIRVADGLLSRAGRFGYSVDGVIRIGGVPTHRLWRDLEDLEATIEVDSVSPLEFSGLGRHSRLHAGSLPKLLSVQLSKREYECRSALIDDDQARFRRLGNELAREPNSEPAMFRALSEAIQPRAMIYLGNSLPVREWDLVAWSNREFDVHASRGLNGIDGQLSTFLGLCTSSSPNWAILGDLTSLYDLAGPWPMGQIPTDIEANLVIVNNSGGKIFDRMFLTPQFQNSHELSFENWARLWGLAYELVEDPRQIETLARQSRPGLRVIELRPDVESTNRFWRAFSEVLN